MKVARSWMEFSAREKAQQINRESGECSVFIGSVTVMQMLDLQGCGGICLTNSMDTATKMMQVNGLSL